MRINTENDMVQVYKDVSGLWRWRRMDMDNGKVVSDGAEGYVSPNYARDAAEAYNPGLLVVTEE